MASPNREAEAEILDEEIATLKAQGQLFALLHASHHKLTPLPTVSSLKRKIKVQSSTVLASDTARSAIQSSANARNPSRAALIDHAAKQRAHIQQCLYRIT